MSGSLGFKDSLISLRDELADIDYLGDVSSLRRIRAQLVEIINCMPQEQIDREVSDCITAIIEESRGYISLRDVLDLVRGVVLEEDKLHVDHHLGFIFLEPKDSGDFAHGYGGGGLQELEEMSVVPRTALLKSLLNEMGCSYELYVGEEPMESNSKMYRSLPYALFKISNLNRMVLVCDESDNATYVICSVEDPEIYARMSKSELQSLPKDFVARLTWSEDFWCDGLKKLLLEDFDCDKQQLDLIDGVKYVRSKDLVDGCYDEDGEQLVTASYFHKYLLGGARKKRLLAVIEEAGIVPVSRVKFVAKSRAVSEMYKLSDLESCKLINFNEAGIASFADRAGNDRQVIEVSKYASTNKMGPNNLQALIDTAGLEKVTGYNFAYANMVYDRFDVDKLIVQVPRISSFTGVGLFPDSEGRNVEVVSLGYYVEALGGEGVFGVKPITVIRKLRSNCKRFIESKVRIDMGDGKGDAIGYAYLKAEVDNLIRRFYPNVAV